MEVLLTSNNLVFKATNMNTNVNDFFYRCLKCLLSIIKIKKLIDAIFLFKSLLFEISYWNLEFKVI